MPAVSRLALGLGALGGVLLGGGIVWNVLSSEPVTVGLSIEGADDQAPAVEGAPAIARPVRPTPEAPTDGGTPPEPEAVAGEGELLREIRIGDRMRAARFPSGAFRSGLEVFGKVLLAAILDGGDVWVRWDSVATRTRFLETKFPPLEMVALESGEILVFLEPLSALFRHVGFSCRLDGSVLRIGAEGVYPVAEPPTPDRPPDVPAGESSPR